MQTLLVTEVQERLSNPNLVLVDIRDINAYQKNHIPHAKHLSQQNLEIFLQETDKEKPVIVYCYHGVSSQGVAKFLLAQGFAEVYSMTGGFEEWLKQYPNMMEFG